MEQLYMTSTELERMNKFAYLAEKLSEARFQFALKCLQTVVQKKPSENVLFCPYSIYEALLIVYYVSGNYTEGHLKRILQLPDIHKIFLGFHYLEDKRYQMLEKSKVYYNKNNCWVKNNKRLRHNETKFFNIDEWNVFDYSENPNLMHNINEVLRNEMQGYISQPVELNRLNKNIEFILSSEFRFKGNTFQSDLPTNMPFKHIFMRKSGYALSSTLGMFVKESLYLKKIQLYQLFPAVQSIVTNIWEVDENISGLVERLTTKEGAEELRKVLEYQELSPESVIHPEFFELEHELSIEELLEDLGIREILEPDKAVLNDLTHENLHLGGAMHRAYVKVTPENVISGAVNMFFTKNGATFKSIEGTNYSHSDNSFVLLIYDRYRHEILFTGVMNKNHQQPEVSGAAHTASSSNVDEMK